MSIGTNLQFLRRRRDMTQEQLAEQMEVSRQTVSKWEADAAWPEMAKMMQLCEIFSCPLDVLVHGDAEREAAEDTFGYDRWKNRFSAVVTACVAMLLLGLTIAAYISCRWPGERAGNLAGLLFLFCLLLAAVPLVVAGVQNETFHKKHPKLAAFYTKEQLDAFDTRFPVYIGAGVGCVLLGLLLAALFSLALPALAWLAGPVFMLMVNIGAPIFVWAGLQKEKYDIEAYNRENGCGGEQEKKFCRTEAVCGIILLLATALFLLLGLGWGRWSSAAVIYPVAGVLCAVAATAMNAFAKK